MQDKAFRLDCGRALVDMCCNMNLEAGFAGGSRHRQAIQQERKILVDEE